MKNKKIILIVCISLIVISGVLIMLFTTNQNNIVKSKTAGKNANSQIQSSTIQTKWNSPEEMDYEILGKKIHLNNRNLMINQNCMKEVYSYDAGESSSYEFDKDSGKLISISNRRYTDKKTYSDEQMKKIADDFIKEQFSDAVLSKYTSAPHWTTQKNLVYAVVYQKEIQGYESLDSIGISVMCDGTITEYSAPNVGRFDNLSKIDEEALKKKVPKKYIPESRTIEFDCKVDESKEPYVGLSMNGKPALVFYLDTFYPKKDGGRPGKDVEFPVEIQ